MVTLVGWLRAEVKHMVAISTEHVATDAHNVREQIHAVIK